MLAISNSIEVFTLKARKNKFALEARYLSFPMHDRKKYYLPNILVFATRQRQIFHQMMQLYQGVIIPKRFVLFVATSTHIFKFSKYSYLND